MDASSKTSVNRVFCFFGGKLLVPSGIYKFSKFFLQMAVKTVSLIPDEFTSVWR